MFLEPGKFALSWLPQFISCVTLGLFGTLQPSDPSLLLAVDTIDSRAVHPGNGGSVWPLPAIGD